LRFIGDRICERFTMIGFLFIQCSLKRVLLTI
jgi:hypothetical protein